ncbi:MAG TPA: lipocalin-like domain-containing protein [Streptosporangiaceae bacterium]|nr:lipocalin-like domain-containing protein [Streptosporangiaceae bacterium]
MSHEVASSTQPFRDRLIGAWRLVSFHTISDDGTPPIYPLGKDATGYIIYTPDGYMSAQIMQHGRSRYEAAWISEGTDSESAQAARGYLAYSGPYHIENDSVIVHQAEVSLFPNWIGEPLSRKAVPDGRHLELTTTSPVLFDGKLLNSVLIWERA